MQSRGVSFLWLVVTGVLFCQESAKQLCIFEGTVRDSVTRAPISKASIRLESTDVKLSNYAGSTDANGAFRFEAVAPGEYHVTTSHRGYSEAKTASLQPGRATSAVKLSAGQIVSDTAIALDAETIVTGRVVDADGDPVAGAIVSALVERWQRGIRTFETAATASTDDRGQYRLKTALGNYHFCARQVWYTGEPNWFTGDPGQPEMRIAPAYYPNAPDIGNAAAVELHPGQQLGGIDFKLSPVVAYHVRGVLKPYAPQPRAPILYLWRGDGDRSNGSYSGASIEKDGSFDIAPVGPGSYVIEFPPLAINPTGGMTVDVLDRDVNGIKFAIREPFELKGRMRFEEEGVTPLPPASVLRLEMLDWHLFHTTPRASPLPDGGFAFRDLWSGQYVLTLPPDQGVYIQSIACSQRDLPAGKIDLTDGPCGDLEVVLGTAVGQLEGSIHLPDPAPGDLPQRTADEIWAVLVSADGQTGNTGVRSIRVDGNGGFRFSNVPPGSYLVFATAHADEDLWQNMDFVKLVARSGTAADLQKKGSIRVEVPILPPEEVRRAIEQVRR